MAINLAALSPEQLVKLKQNNPTLYYESLNVAQPTKTGTAPASAPKTIGEQETGLTRQQVVDRLAGAGNTKAQEMQKNNYALPTPTSSVADRTELALPDAQRKGSLVEFADALDQATSLARSRRQSSELGILEDYGFKPGQVSAGTMGSILNLLEARTDKSYGALQDAAVQAYRDQEQQKVVDQQNVQELALSLLTKGVDQTTIQGILNAPDFNSAISMAAGALKGTGQYSDIRTATVDGKLSFFGVKEDGTVERLAEFGTGGVGGGGEFTDTQKMKLEAAGLLNAPRSEQLAFLYPSDQDTTRSRKDEYVEFQEFADQYPGSDQELKNYLLQNKEFVDDGDVNAIIAARAVTETKAKSMAADVIADVWDKKLLATRSGGELDAAKTAARKDILAGNWDDIVPGSKTAERVLAAILAITYDDVKDLL